MLSFSYYYSGVERMIQDVSKRVDGRAVRSNRAAQRLSALSHGRVLDIGFAERPNPYLRGEIIGFDLTPAPCPTNYARTVVGDMRALADHFPRELFDTIIFGYCIGLVETVTPVLMQATGLLNSGGTLIVSWANPYDPVRVLLHWLGVYHEDLRFVATLTPENILNLFGRCGLVGLRVHKGSELVLPIHGVQVPCPKSIASLLIYEGRKP